MLDLGFPRVDHRLDREGHPRLQADAGSGAAVMEDLRLLVKSPPDAMAAEFTHHAVSILLGVRLDRVSDVAEVHARARCFYSTPHALIGDVAQPARLDRGFARVEHAAR